MEHTPGHTAHWSTHQDTLHIGAHTRTHCTLEHTSVEEEVSHNRRLPMDFQWMATEYNLLTDHTIGINLVDSTRGYQRVDNMAVCMCACEGGGGGGLVERGQLLGAMLKFKLQPTFSDIIIEDQHRAGRVGDGSIDRGYCDSSWSEEAFKLKQEMAKQKGSEWGHGRKERKSRRER